NPAKVLPQLPSAHCITEPHCSTHTHHTHTLSHTHTHTTQHTHTNSTHTHTHTHTHREKEQLPYICSSELQVCENTPQSHTLSYKHTHTLSVMTAIFTHTHTHTHTLVQKGLGAFLRTFFSFSLMTHTHRTGASSFGVTHTLKVFCSVVFFFSRPL